MAFSCKKLGSKNFDLLTKSNQNKLDKISIIYNQEIKNNLKSFDINNLELGFDCNGFISNPNFYNKKSVFILFINSKFIL